jgi:hypothetical protein
MDELVIHIRPTFGGYVVRIDATPPTKNDPLGHATGQQRPSCCSTTRSTRCRAWLGWRSPSASGSRADGPLQLQEGRRWIPSFAASPPSPACRAASRGSHGPQRRPARRRNSSGRARHEPRAGAAGGAPALPQAAQAGAAPEAPAQHAPRQQARPPQAPEGPAMSAVARPRQLRAGTVRRLVGAQPRPRRRLRRDRAARRHRLRGAGKRQAAVEQHHPDRDAVKGHEPTAADELAALNRGLDRHRRRARPHKVDPVTGFCGGCDDLLESKRPRHSGEGGEAESAGPERGVGGPGVRELQS